jgi:hypothetical protein
MKKSLEEAERCQRNALDAQRKSEGLVEEATRIRRRVEHENRTFSERIDKLSQDLQSSRATVDTMVAHAREQDRATKERDRNYRHIIKEMKHQFRRQENAVSFGLYQKAVSEAKHATGESSQHKAVAERLKAKVAHLEKTLQVSQRGTVKLSVPQHPPQSTPRDHRNVFKIDPTSFLDQPPSQAGMPFAGDGISNQPTSAQTNLKPACAHTGRSSSPISQTQVPGTQSARQPRSVRSTSEISQPPILISALKPALKSTTLPTTPFANDVNPKSVAFETETSSPASPNMSAHSPHRHLDNVPRLGQSKTPYRLEFSKVSPDFESNRSRIRISMVRQAGGRKTMQSKLREMRSPRLNNNGLAKVGAQVFQKRLGEVKVRVRPGPFRENN